MQRAINGLCVAWKPLMAPQATVMKSAGKMLSFSSNRSMPMFSKWSQSSGNTGIFTYRQAISATAMNNRAKAKMG